MADHEDGKVNFKSELGITRRDLLRRGAIAGGTLLWAAPVIQSLRTPAFAQTVPAHSCCQCSQNNNSGVRCQQDSFTAEQCDSFCSTPSGNTVVSYQTGTDCSCVSNQCRCE